MPKSFDPITLEILWQRLVSIVDEADASVARTAFSSLLRDAHDYTCMFTDSRGQELVQGTFCTPGQAGAMAIGVKQIIRSHPLEDYRPGDVFIVNDPWLLAGHLNDVCVLSPIFYKNRPVAFTACVFHHSDIGGRVSSDNREVFEEGLFIPLLKLYDAGELNEDVVRLIRWNVRTPEEVVGDIRSQVAANHVCARKVIEMMTDEGLDSLDDLADEIIGHTERSMRAAISRIPNGVYPYEGVIEGAGQRDDLETAIGAQDVERRHFVVGMSRQGGVDQFRLAHHRVVVETAARADQVAGRLLQKGAAQRGGRTGVADAHLAADEDVRGGHRGALGGVKTGL